MTIRIVLADDHTLFRQGLRRVLELEPEFEVVAEASNGDEALAQVGRLNPEVVVLDVSMPGGGLEAAQTIRQRHAGMGIVILTMHEDAEYLAKAIRAGANSYLVKDVDSQHLLEAIRAAREGRPYVHPKLAGLLLQTQLNRPEGSAGNPGGLTERELDVLRLVGQGSSNREIAQTLFISEKTAKNHLTHIFEKLGVTDRTQAALYAVRAGLVPLKQ